MRKSERARWAWSEAKWSSPPKSSSAVSEPCMCSENACQCSPIRYSRNRLPSGVRHGDNYPFAEEACLVFLTNRSQRSMARSSWKPASARCNQHDSLSPAVGTYKRLILLRPNRRRGMAAEARGPGTRPAGLTPSVLRAKATLDPTSASPASAIAVPIRSQRLGILLHQIALSTTPQT